MERVFVVGLALELAGAILLAWEFFAVSPNKIFFRDVPTYGGGDPGERQRNVARALVGFVFLALGFLVQILGYAIDGGASMLLLAWIIIGGALVIGLTADRPIAAWLKRQAEKGKDQQSSP